MATQLATVECQIPLFLLMLSGPLVLAVLAVLVLVLVLCLLLFALAARLLHPTETQLGNLSYGRQVLSHPIGILALATVSNFSNPRLHCR